MERSEIFQNKISPRLLLEFFGLFVNLVMRGLDDDEDEMHSQIDSFWFVFFLAGEKVQVWESYLD